MTIPDLRGHLKVCETWRSTQNITIENIVPNIKQMMPLVVEAAEKIAQKHGVQTFIRLASRAIKHELDNKKDKQKKKEAIQRRRNQMTELEKEQQDKRRQEILAGQFRSERIRAKLDQKKVVAISP